MFPLGVLASTGELGIPGKFKWRSSSELLIMSLWNQGSQQKRMKSTQSPWGECFDLIAYKSQNASICEAHQGIHFFRTYILLDISSKTVVEKAMATHSSTLAWKIPWMEGPGRLQSMGLLGVGHDWATSLSLFTFHFHALEKEIAAHSSVLAWRIPGTGEPGGLPSLGSHRVGHDWSDLAAGLFIRRIPRSVSKPLQSQSGHLALQIPSYLISAYMCRCINGYTYIGMCRCLCMYVWVMCDMNGQVASFQVTSGKKKE